MDEQQTMVSQEGFPTVDELNAEKRPDGNDQLTLFSLQELAVKGVNSIGELQEQLKTATEMFGDSFVNNPEYREQQKRLQEEESKLNAIKSRILREPGVIAQESKVKEIRNEIKEKQGVVSSYALEVLRQSGQTEFEKDGEKYEIKTVAKLVKRKQ